MWSACNAHLIKHFCFCFEGNQPPVSLPVLACKLQYMWVWFQNVVVMAYFFLFGGIWKESFT